MNKLKKNVILNMSYQVLILIVPFITTPYVSRVLLPDGVGLFSVTTAVAKYFWLFALMGMSNHGCRVIAVAKDSGKDEMSRAFWNLFYFQAAIALLFSGLYLVYVAFWGYETYNIVSLCQMPYVLSALFDVSWFFYGTEQFKIMVKRNIIIKLLTMAAIFSFVKNTSDVWIYALINAVSLLVGQLCLWPFIVKKLCLKKPEWCLIKNHIKPNCVLFISVISVSVYTQLSKVLLGNMCVLSELGLYENAEKMMGIMNGIVGAIGVVMLPRMSNIWGKDNRKEAELYVSKSMKYIMAFSIALSFGMAAISEEFAVVFFGIDFQACSLLIKIFSLAVMAYAWENIVRTHYLIPKHKEAIFVQATIVAAIVNLIVNVTMIPRTGAIGAVIGSVSAQTIAAGYQSFRIRRELPSFRYLVRLIPFVIAATVMYICCRAIGQHMGISVLTIAAQILCGGVVFISMSAAILVVERDPLMVSIVKKIKNKIGS